MYDIGKGTVLKILTDNGVPRRRSPLRPDQVAKAVALYEQGWSIEKIGSKLGRHDTVVREALRKAGLSVSKDQEHSS